MFYWLLTHIAMPSIVTLVIILVAFFISVALNPN